MQKKKTTNVVQFQNCDFKLEKKLVEENFVRQKLKKFQETDNMPTKEC